MILGWKAMGGWSGALGRFSRMSHGRNSRAWHRPPQTGFSWFKTDFPGQGFQLPIQVQAQRHFRLARPLHQPYRHRLFQPDTQADLTGAMATHQAL